MNHKIGRNDPCWCGSGIKYKKCHLNREEQTRPHIWKDAVKKIEEGFNEKKCYAPNEHELSCHGEIINAHSISAEKNLRPISKNGKVYKFIPHFKQYVSAFQDNIRDIQPELVGIKDKNKASTFTGFCEKHDKIFSPIENIKFIENKEQNFLLAYRTLCMELQRKKQSAAEGMKAFLKNGDKGFNLRDQHEYQEKINDYIKRVEESYKYLNDQKQEFDSILINKDFSKIKSFFVKFDNIPNIACSNILFPDCDFHGNTLQDFNSDNPSALYVNTIIEGDTGYVMFSWHHSNGKVNEKFIESLMAIEKKRVTDAIIRLIFNFFDNSFFSPEWWDSLPSEKQSSLKKIHSSTLNYFIDCCPNCLVENNISYDNWSCNSMGYLSCCQTVNHPYHQ